jgi:hypothetical protein
MAISLIKNRLQDTYGSRLKFVSGSAAQGRAGSPLPADGGASVPASRLVSSLAPPDSGGAHGVTRFAESTVRIIGNPPRLHCRLTLNPHLSTINFQMGTLYYGDNLEILRRYLKDETFKKAPESKKKHGEQKALEL